MSKIKHSYVCSLELTHSLIGGKWKIRILWHILQGDSRFSELKKVLPEITEKVLYTNLRELEATGILTKTVDEKVKPTAVIYSLNEEFSELKEIIYAICDFTNNYARHHEIKITQQLTKK